MSRAEITTLLEQAATGDAAAMDEVTARVYGELERFARHKMRAHFGAELPGVTLEPAAIVNETFLKLLAQPRPFANRRHFFAFANRVMTRVLADYHRARRTRKRGGNQLRVTLTGIADEETTSLGDLARVLEELERQDPRKAEVVKLRVFWGLEMTEIAETTGSSLRTVERDWRFSRNWLRSQLERT